MTNFAGGGLGNSEQSLAGGNIFCIQRQGIGQIVNFIRRMGGGPGLRAKAGTDESLAMMHIVLVHAMPETVPHAWACHGLGNPTTQPKERHQDDHPGRRLFQFHTFRFFATTCHFHWAN